MPFFKKLRTPDYDIFSPHAWYVPGVGGMFVMLGWLLIGAIIGNIVTFAFTAIFGAEAGTEYGTLVSYPLMFIPPMIYSRLASGRNTLFETGYHLDNNHFSPVGGALAAVLVVVATVAASFCSDIFLKVLPPMPEWLESTLKSMTQGKVWVNFLCVSIFAPFFEEWLCRGVVLRGLLNSKRADGTSMHPAWAIVLSAVFFAFIHLNPWQAIPAFLLGCLFGYVYWRTGSLKLTMLMHFTNNTLALALGHTEMFKDAESWLDVLPPVWYGVGFVVSVGLIAAVVLAFRQIPVRGMSGNCDEIPAA